MAITVDLSIPNVVQRADRSTLISDELVSGVAKIFRDSFINDTVIAATWDTTIEADGTISQVPGTLTINSGGQIAATTILSRDSFTMPTKLGIVMSLSARRANQEFEISLVSIGQDGNADDRHVASWVFDGTVATQAKYRVNSGPLTPLDSAAVTATTTASLALYELELYPDNAWFHSSTVDSLTGRANSYRRNQRTPNHLLRYKIRLRWRNTGIPAGTTDAVISNVYAESFREVPVEATPGPGTLAVSSSMPVVVTNGGGALGVNIIGQVNHGGSVVTAPVRIGAAAQSTMPANLTNGLQTNLYASLDGKLIVLPYAIPDAFWSFTSAIGGLTTGSDAVAKAAGAAPIGSNYVTSLQLQNNSATASEFQIKDGGTVIWRCMCPANMPVTNIRFEVPLRGTTATALNVQAVTAASVIIASLQGYQGY